MAGRARSIDTTEHWLACGLATFAAVIGIAAPTPDGEPSFGVRAALTAVGLAAAGLVAYSALKREEGSRSSKFFWLWLGLAAAIGVGVLRAPASELAAGGSGALTAGQWLAAAGGVAIVAAAAWLAVRVFSRIAGAGRRRG
ncbi:MAG: hypothetical protein R6V85_01000 [Polyangia bacterium]